MNPFRYTEPVPVEDLLDRDTEAKDLLTHATNGINSRLVAPRRYGKTSLLQRVIDDAGKAGWATVYVDFFGVLTLSDIAERIERSYAEQLEKRLQSWFAGVRRKFHPTFSAGGGPIPARVDFQLDAQAEPPLLDRLALPRQLYLRHQTRTLVVFDEFQDVLATTDRADAVIRSEIQHHADAASYIFAGSDVGMMRELFINRRRAFYGQAHPVTLPPLSATDVADYVAERFQRADREIGEALDPLLELAQGHPQRTMLLAHVIWELTPQGHTATEETWHAAYTQVMQTTRDELRAIWSALSTSQRRTLTAIAENTNSLYGIQRQHGGSRGGSIHAAVQVLQNRGEVVQDENTITQYRLVDPLLAAWILEGRPGS